MTRTPTNRIQLDRPAWVDAALDLLAEGGLDAVRVEVLAKTLMVTKGSFYWHFKDRAELLAAMLDTWNVGRIQDIIKQTTAPPGKELDQIYHVIDVYSASRNRKGIQIELAVRDWARRDPKAEAVVTEVDTARLECARRLFVESGMQPAAASAHTMLLYAYVFGMSLMRYSGFEADLPGIKKSIADLIAGSPVAG